MTALTAETWKRVALVQQLSLMVLAELTEATERLELLRESMRSADAIRRLLSEIEANACRAAPPGSQI